MVVKYSRLLQDEEDRGRKSNEEKEDGVHNDFHFEPVRVKHRKKLIVSFLSGLIIILFVTLTAVAYHSDDFFEQPSVRRQFWRFNEEQARNFALRNSIDKLQASKAAANALGSHDERNLSFDVIRRRNPETRFNIRGNDVLVFLHIQKTAGTTFEKNLVKNLALDRPCECKKPLKKKCKCLRPKNEEKNSTAKTGNEKEKDEWWLFSRFSTGWACGLHADWTELVTSNCVDAKLDQKDKKRKKRRYFYTTFLREPISRYLSEFSHVQRGAGWLGSLHYCNGRLPSPEELPLCFDPNTGWDCKNSKTGAPFRPLIIYSFKSYLP